MRLALAAALLAGAASAEEISLEDVPRIAADVVILGEVHDNPGHHLNQAAAVAAVAPKALVFEMFGPQAALRVKPGMAFSPDALAEALGWADSGWPDFAYYHPIFVAAPEAAIFGGDLPRDQVRQAVMDGAAEVFGPGAALFGLDAPLPEDEVAEREQLQMEAHCNALPESMASGMVEAQRLRDAALAQAVVAAMADTGGPVVLITGNGHARRDWGVPRMLERVLPDASVVTVAQYETAAPEDPPFDYWFVTPAAPRDDPCDAFAK
ncbi:MAG: ChaN family lipoprotein [Pseudomonadota bacterium]